MNKDPMQYNEDWQSLKQHKTPEWMMDGKFGIYTHWTPVTVATKDNHGDWYGYTMYMDKHTLGWNGEIVQNKPHAAYKYHVEKYGSPDKFGYKDLIKLFQPKKFDAQEWADIFEKAGAKFAGPVAVHHDNFSMWDSKITRWNIKENSGFDALGELEKAIKGRGMKLITTFHHSYSWNFFIEAYKFDAKDPQYADLYCVPHERIEPPSEEFEDIWYEKLNEVMVNYQPDLIWFDMGFENISDTSRKKFMARYFNLSNDWQKDVGVCYKIKSNPPLPPETGILDFELGRSDQLLDNFWVTDTSFGPWFYQDQMKDGTGLKTANHIITMLIDIISKNGSLLLNVPPNENGEIIPYLKDTLTDIGNWLRKNGEAVYNTRPWKIYGEGPTKLDKPFGGFNETKGFKYSPEDIRYTRSKNNKTLYATVLAWPGENKQVTLNAFSKGMISPSITVERISIIGYDDDISWKQNDNGLIITLPDTKVDDTFVMKIETKNDVMAIDVTDDFVSEHPNNKKSDSNFMA